MDATVQQVKPEHQHVVDVVESVRHIWQERIGLSHVEIEFVYLDSFYGEDDNSDFKVTASTETRWAYDMAKVKFYLLSAVRHSDEHLEKVVVHELVHVLLGSEQELLYNKKEAATGGNPFTDVESEILQSMFDERLEQSTERATRAIFNGWGSLL